MSAIPKGVSVYFHEFSQFGIWGIFGSDIYPAMYIGQRNNTSPEGFVHLFGIFGSDMNLAMYIGQCNNTSPEGFVHLFSIFGSDMNLAMYIGQCNNTSPEGFVHLFEESVPLSDYYPEENILIKEELEFGGNTVLKVHIWLKTVWLFSYL